MTQKESIFKALCNTERQIFTVRLNCEVITENATPAHIRMIMLEVRLGNIDPTGIEIIAHPDNTCLFEQEEQVFTTTIQQDGCLYNDLAGMSYENDLAIKLFLFNRKPISQS